MAGRALLLGLAALPCALLAQPAPPPEAPAAQVATTTDDTSRLRVPVMINNVPLRFLVDSASTRSVVAIDVAERLALPRGPDVRVHNIGGVDTVPTVMIPTLQLSNIVVHDVRAPALLHSNLGGEGLVGLDLLKGQRITIDFLHHAQLTISPSSKQPEPREAPDEPGTIVVTAKSKLGELIVTDADIEGKSVAVIIDTGSEDSIGNTALRDLVSKRLRHAEIKPTTLMSVTGRLLPADYALIGRARIGGVEIENLPVAFAEAATFKQFGLAHKPAILLGMETLRLFDKVTIDFPRKQIRFVLGHPHGLYPRR